MLLGARRGPKLPELHHGDLDRVVQESPVGTTFVLFDRGGDDDRLTAAALAEAQRAHPDGVRAFVAKAADYSDYIEQRTAAKRAFDTFDFTRRPCVGLYREGRLITTFSPRKVFYNPKLQAREVGTQLGICIRKFCEYDPKDVREQTNIAEAMKHEAQEGKPADGLKQR